MDDHTQIFVGAYDEQLDAVLTQALRHTYWADDAADVAAVIFVALRQRLAADPTSMSLVWLAERVESLSPERVKAGGKWRAFLDRHLPRGYGSVRMPIADLGDSLEDLGLNQGDTVDTSTGPAAICAAALRDAIVAAGTPRPRWWRR